MHGEFIIFQKLLRPSGTDRLALTHPSACRSKLLVSDWSEEDVSAWLAEEGLGGLVDKFRANNIDGTELLCLTKETLASELHIGEEDKHHTLLGGCYVTSPAPCSLHSPNARFCSKCKNRKPVLWVLHGWSLVSMNTDVYGLGFLHLFTWIKSSTLN